MAVSSSIVRSTLRLTVAGLTAKLFENVITTPLHERGQWTVVRWIRG